VSNHKRICPGCPKSMLELDTGCSTQNTGCSKFDIFYKISQNCSNWVSKVSNHKQILPGCQKIWFWVRYRVSRLIYRVFKIFNFSIKFLKIVQIG